MTEVRESSPDADGEFLCDETALRLQIVRILTAWGMPEDSAALTADIMVDTDLSGIDSHGVSMLMMYESLYRKGRLDLTAQPTVARDGAAFAVLDAHNGLGHPVAVRAMDLAVELAQANGIGMVAVRNSHHFGAAGYYVRSAAHRGLISMVTSTTRTPVVAATGAHSPVLGTNPLAFGAPRTDAEPFVIDMSTSVVAMNKVKSYGLQNRPLPAGWVTDREGNVVTDANSAFEMLLKKKAVLSPLGGPDTIGGGHKGFGLSMMVQILSAALSNAAAPGHDGEHDNIGHFFMAIDPEAVNPGGGTIGNIDGFTSAVLDGDLVLMPGEVEARSRIERSVQGIPVSRALREHLVAICVRAGVEFILDSSESATGAQA